MARKTRMPWALLALLGAGGCVLQADDHVTGPSPITGVLLSPSPGTAEAGSPLPFQATVVGPGPVPQGVSWYLLPGSGPYAIGRIDAAGVYTVDAPPPLDTREYVVATSIADPSHSATAAVDIPAFSILVAPARATLFFGDRLQFSATVRGVADKTVAWHCIHGSIDANGLYTAPAAPVSGRDAVWADSAAGRKSAESANVRLRLRPIVLTGFSGTLPGKLTVLGSGFLPGVAGAGRQVGLEDVSGQRVGAPGSLYDIQDRFSIDIYLTGSWVKLWLYEWLYGGDPPDAVTSNEMALFPY